MEKAYNEDTDNEFIISGITKIFYIQFELGWKVLKYLLTYEGTPGIDLRTPRQIIINACKIFDFMNKKIWFLMLQDRNDTSHIYDGNMAKRLVARILEEYIPEFRALYDNILNTYKDSIKNIG